MTGLAKMISTPMSKATSVMVLAGCLLLGVLIGMSPMYTGRSSNNNSGSRPSNLRATNTPTEVTPASSIIPATPKQQDESGPSKMPSRLSEAQLFRVTPQDLAVDNTDETEGAESKAVEAQDLVADDKEDVAGVGRFESRSPDPYLEEPEPFFWGETFPNYQDLDLDQFAVPVEESLAYIDSSYSYDFVGLDLVGLSASSSPLSFSYEF